MKKVLKDHNADKFFEHDRWYGHGNTSDISGLMAKESLYKLPKDEYSEFKRRFKSGKNGIMPKRNTKEGRDFCNDLKKLYNGIVKTNNNKKVLDRHMVGTIGYICFPSVIMVGNTGVLVFPFIDKEKDEPQLTDEIKKQVKKKIKKWQFEKMVEEYNESIKA